MKARMIEVEGQTFLKIAGVRRVYLTRAGERVAYADDDWCVLVRRKKGSPWASVRVFRLFDGVRAFSFGVSPRLRRATRSEGSIALAKEYPGVADWATRAVYQHLDGRPVTRPPEVERKPPPPATTEATKDEERKIVELIRQRLMADGVPLSRRRVTRQQGRYAGDKVEDCLGVPEPAAFEAIRKMVSFGVLEDYLVDRRSRMRGLRVNETAFAEYFGEEKEGEDV